MWRVLACFTSYLGKILENFWPYLGHIFAISWPYFCHILAVSQPYPGHIFPYLDHILTISWSYLHLILTIYWSYLDHILAIFSPRSCWGCERGCGRGCESLYKQNVYMVEFFGQPKCRVRWGGGVGWIQVGCHSLTNHQLCDPDGRHNVKSLIKF